MHSIEFNFLSLVVFREKFLNALENSGYLGFQKCGHPQANFEQWHAVF